jgi:hypothetical protein
MASHPGLIQVRLSKKGCVQYDDLKGIPTVHEVLGSYSWLITLAGFVVMLVMRRDIDRLQFWIWCPLLLFGSIVLWPANARFRRSLGTLSEASVADANAIIRPFKPWERFSDFVLHPMEAGKYRLRIYRQAWRFKAYAIDAEVKCTDEQAERLRLLLRAWIGETQSA